MTITETRVALALHARARVSLARARVIRRASLQSRDLWPTFIMANKFAGKHFLLFHRTIFLDKCWKLSAVSKEVQFIKQIFKPLNIDVKISYS